MVAGMGLGRPAPASAESTMIFDIDETLGYLVNRAAVVLRQDLQRRFRAAGLDLTAEEWAVLGQLWKHDGLSRQALADRTIKDQTTVTRLLDALVAKGFVQRTQHPADRRIVQHWLTRRGQELQSQLVPLAQAMLAEATSGIPEEDLAATLRTLRRIQENLRAGTAEPGGQL
jgi:DNA-binding MarR family transcriptional regulator